MRLRYSKKLGLTSAFKPFGFCALFCPHKELGAPKPELAAYNSSPARAQLDKLQLDCLCDAY